MYRLSNNCDVVTRVSDGAAIPRGHRWWDEYGAWCAAGNVPEPASSAATDYVAETKLRITQWLDSVVQAKGYDNIVSCASYASSSDDTFRAEAQAAIAWRDAVYRRGYEILADIPEGVTTPEQVMALLPQPTEFGWPTA